MGIRNRHVLPVDWETPDLGRKYFQVGNGADDEERAALRVPKIDVSLSEASDQLSLPLESKRPL